jgi:hypothetical protein
LPNLRKRRVLFGSKSAGGPKMSEQHSFAYVGTPTIPESLTVPEYKKLRRSRPHGARATGHLRGRRGADDRGRR